MSYRIIGTGSSLPSKRVTNDDLSKFLDTSDEWIYTRTGIKSRRIMTTETLSQLATESARIALEDASCRADEIDYVIAATLRADTVTPSLAFAVAENLKIAAPAFDINAACVGLIYALDLAEGLFAAGKAEKVLIVTAEAMSKHLDWTDRASCVLFGDGAGAMVLERGADRLASSITGAPDTQVIREDVSGSNSPFNEAECGKTTLFLGGQDVYKFAVVAMGKEIEKVCDLAGITLADVDFVLPHQANVRIVDASMKKFKIPKEKVLMNISEYGNMSATSITVLLDEYAKKGTFKRGDILLLVAFGAGLTSGAALLKWTK